MKKIDKTWPLIESIKNNLLELKNKFLYTVVQDEMHSINYTNTEEPI